MFALCKKEIVSFFSSITGYLVAGVFLLMTALFLWIVPGQSNIPMGGYATLEPLFWMAPWLFLFLVPAVTMRLLADEKKSGTLEILLTKPLSDWQIVGGKYLAGFILVVVSILPTLVYFFSIHKMAQPLGNIDHGAIWGSYIGLLLLGAVYTSIGLFTSSTTSNQIVAFIFAVVLSFLFYSGFDTLASIPFLKSSSSWLVNLGIGEHYQSISRGVVDFRDLTYFVGVVVIFLALTKMMISRKRW